MMKRMIHANHVMMNAIHALRITLAKLAQLQLNRVKIWLHVRFLIVLEIEVALLRLFARRL